jgi:hypothetical protein
MPDHARDHAAEMLLIEAECLLAVSAVIQVVISEEVPHER